MSLHVLWGIVQEVYDTEDIHTMKVRILHIDGLPDNAEGASAFNRTSDENLPEIPYDLPDPKAYSDAKSAGYEKGAIVRIDCPSGTLESARVTGVVKTAEETKNLEWRELFDFFKTLTSFFVKSKSNTSGLNNPQSTSAGGSTAYSVPNANLEFANYFGLPYNEDTPFSVTSAYGDRPLFGDFHLGVDLSANDGAPIYAVSDGVVCGSFGNWSESMGIDGMASYGNYVTIRHNPGPDGKVYWTHYAHLQSLSKNLCDLINNDNGTCEVKGTNGNKKGTLIGYQGSTGHSTGTHLHFEILTDFDTSGYHNKQTTHNPEEYIQFRPATGTWETFDITGSNGENAKKLWAFGLSCGMNAYQCAGMLGNMQQESNIDPSSVEGIWDEWFRIGEKKASLFSDNSFNQPEMNDFALTLPKIYGSSELNWPAYVYDDSAIDQRTGEPYVAAGLGIIGFTGSWARGVLDTANTKSQNWYDLDIQVYTMVNCEYVYAINRFNNYLNYSQGRTSVYEACAAWAGLMEAGQSEAQYTASSLTALGNRQIYAQQWYNTLKDYVPEEGSPEEEFVETVQGWLDESLGSNWLNN